MKNIRSVLTTFSKSFESKDWNLLLSVLDNDIIIDYSGLHGFSGRTSSENFVLQRKKTLSNIDVSHFLSPLKIGINEDRALCKAYAIIYRLDSFRHFNTHTDYVFGFIKKNGSWLIKSIKQDIIWNDGNKNFLIAG